jgi:hypothetical protein
VHDAALHQGVGEVLGYRLLEARSTVCDHELGGLKPSGLQVFEQDRPLLGRFARPESVAEQPLGAVGEHCERGEHARSTAPWCWTRSPIGSSGGRPTSSPSAMLVTNALGMATENAGLHPVR